MNRVERVLISGASGFIGSNVLKYLLKNTEWDFVCISSWRHKGNPLFTPPNPRVTMVTHDLTGVIPDLGEFDYILNLASESHVDRSITDPVNFIENNVSTTLQMLEYARKHPPFVFLQFSTDEVYGANQHKEWDVLLPSNPYAASKAAQEMICISYWKTYAIPLVITNSNNIVGPNQDKEKFVPKVIDLIKNDKEVLIHCSNDKPGTRYWNPVNNVADAIKFILKISPVAYPFEDRPHRYALSGGKELDNLQMAVLISKILGKQLKARKVNAENIRPGYDQFYAKTEGDLEKLGWSPVETLEEGLAWIS